LDLLRLRPREVRIFHTFHGHVLSGYFGPLRSRLFVWVERLLALVTDRIITVSQGLREELVSLEIARPGRIAVVPLGLDLEPFEAVEGRRGHLRAGIGVSEKEPLVGIVGRLVPIKRHEDFLQAARLVLSRWDDGPTPRFVVVGDGEERSRLEELTKGLALESSVHFLGFCTDMPAIYADLDLLVLCSLNEGTPVAVIEALAAGVPVVATAVGGVGDVVVHGETGLLVPPRAPDALAEAVLRLLRDEALRRRLAREGSARVLQRYRVQRLVRDLVQLYEGGT
ncbi:MAG: glycosyltransferase family 4 protein, partial [Deltaproteobacteria bacterium]|nr:glycosyltransferase family 4 protein [Deltaproteobacteria bacterium]